MLALRQWRLFQEAAIQYPISVLPPSMHIYGDDDHWLSRYRAMTLMLSKKKFTAISLMQ